MKRDAKKTWTVMITVFAMVVTLCLPAASPAQESTGSIEGVVSDPSGAVVAGATVTITSKKTGRSLTTTTTGAGVFIMRAIQPGEYEVKVEASGFKTGVRQVTVQVGAASIGDVSLEVGSPTEVVTVQAESSLQVNTVENKVYDVINQRQIENLPLNGRNFLDLAQLSPGVQIVDGGNFDPTKNQFTGISVGGRSGRVTRIQVDGIDISDETVGTTTQNISQDALQEFQLSQSSLDPSTSLTSSGAVNIVTRSGGNDIHGSAFFFYRDEEVAAVPVTFTGIESIDQQLKSAEFDREQGGFSVGGPFIKDKLFWFVNFEKS
ncbi:MAG: TonB-dependent receptor, partial [Blastocatellia bacterium]|nr:TonB-dependent receptor [Blastocatellia bacterium]